jgi:hypothetical protein
MISIRLVLVGLALVSATLISPPTAEAGLCGFPGAVLAGANVAGGPGENRGYVVLFDVATGIQNGIASVPLGPAYGEACMNVWRDATLGPDPTNFVAVWAQSPANGNPAVCADQGCSAPGSFNYCRLATLCMAFP